MTEENTEQTVEKPKDNPLATNMTFGEKVHHGIFDIGINFFLNLTVSAVFTHWVSHSQAPFKIFGKEFSAPSVIQRKVGKFIHDLPILHPFGKKITYDISHVPLDNMRVGVATTMAGVFTLTAAGHPIMIPSVWLGAKIKAPMVKWLNRMHYGDAAMETPEMQQRQALIETQEKPTGLGAVLGRAGTIVATQAVGYSIGNKHNVIGIVGKKLNIPLVKAFRGIDHLTEFSGEVVGGQARKLFPNTADKVDTYLRNKQFGFSTGQLQMTHALRGKPYGYRTPQGYGGGGFEHFGKYLASDILYSGVTALTIGPAINFLKKFIPGLTYHDKAETVLTPKQLRELRIHSNPIADSDPAIAPQTPETSADVPQIRISDIKHVKRVATPPDQEKEPQVTV